MRSTWLRINDIGHPFTIPVNKDDLADTIFVEFQVKRANDDCVVWTVDSMQQNKNKPDSIDVTHFIKEGDIDIIGNYYVNVHAKTSGDQDITTPTVRLDVKDKTK